MASTKQQQKSNAFIGIGIALLIFSPFLILSVFKYFSLKKQYMSGNNCHRVVDIGTLKIPMTACASLVFITYLAFTFTAGIHKALSILIICIAILVAYKMAQWVAVKYIGAIIDADRRVVYFPPDMQSYGVEDYLTGKFLKDMSILDMVKIDSIDRITRQVGKRLYLHGQFGSRGIFFSDKQKRDECMSAIQQLAGKNVIMYEMEQSNLS